MGPSPVVSCRETRIWKTHHSLHVILFLGTPWFSPLHYSIPAMAMVYGTWSSSKGYMRYMHIELYGGWQFHRGPQMCVAPFFFVAASNSLPNPHCILNLPGALQQDDKTWWYIHVKSILLQWYVIKLLYNGASPPFWWETKSTITLFY